MITARFLAACGGAPEGAGTLGRNAIREPGAWNLDLTVAKNFRFFERYGLQFRADLFNSLIQMSLTSVSSNIVTGNLGRLTAAASRSIQSNARLTF